MGHTPIAGERGNLTNSRASLGTYPAVPVQGACPMVGGRRMNCIILLSENILECQNVFVRNLKGEDGNPI